MIKLCRVDHRLLHGQVAFTWCNSVNADCILIASDEVASDEIRMTTMRLAKPTGVKLVIKDMKDSISALNSGVTDKYKLLIITESIKDAYALAKSVPEIKYINLGGAKIADDRKQISKAMFVSEEDIKMIKELNEDGVKQEIQMVPEDIVEDVMSLI